jgi:hypothetical protein
MARDFHHPQQTAEYLTTRPEDIIRHRAEKVVRKIRQADGSLVKVVSTTGVAH